MNKILISIVLAACLSAPAVILAQTDTAQQSNVREQIKTLTLLIAQLELQLRQVMAGQQFQDYTAGQANQTAQNAGPTFVSVPASVSTSKPTISVVPIVPFASPAPVASAVPVCTPDWQCADWSTCSDSTQTRICADSNNCNSSAGEPALAQSCATAAPAANPATVSNAPVGANTSSNWSGYAATGTNFSAINGSWTIPEQTASSTGLTGDAAWIGIGGIGSSDLIQIGTQTFSSNGQVGHKAFYETLPQTAQNISMPIGTSDSISASLTQQSASQWYLSVRDNTNGQHFETTVAYASSGTSAEWIEEMPSNSDSSFIPLDSFGAEQFSDGSVQKNGGSYTIDQSGAHAITMTNSNDEALTLVSGLGIDGESFSVTRTAVAPTSFANWQKSSSGSPYRRGFDIHGYSNGSDPLTQ